MDHPMPKPFKGNYPFAVLHAYRTEGILTAVAIADRISREPLTKEEAFQYVKAVVETKGHPQILDLIEKEQETKADE